MSQGILGAAHRWIWVVLGVGLGAGCGSARHAEATPPAEGTAPDTAALSVRPGTFQDRLLSRLPADTFLVVTLNEGLITDALHRLARDQSDQPLKHALLRRRFKWVQEDTLPEDWVAPHQNTVFIVTMNEVGLSDEFTWLEGTFDVDFVRSTLTGTEATTRSVHEDTTLYGPLPGEELEQVVVHRESVGLAAGPADRAEEVIAFTTDRPSPRAHSTLQRGFALATTERWAVACYLGNTPGLSLYLRQSFAESNLTDDIVDSFHGAVATLDLRDGARLEMSLLTSGDSATDEIADQVDDLLKGLEGHPVVAELDMGELLESRQRRSEGNVARFVVESSEDRLRDLLDRLVPWIDDRP